MGDRFDMSRPMLIRDDLDATPMLACLSAAAGLVLIVALVIRL